MGDDFNLKVWNGRAPAKNCGKAIHNVRMRENSTVVHIRLYNIIPYRNNKIK